MNGIGLEMILATAMLVSLNFYALAGGADFGGGVWDLLARGARAKQQRRLIAQAIAPIWEANHVWLILVIVILFTAFPPAFAAISTALHIPITLMLIGIVLRGSAFIFRSYTPNDDTAERRWSRLFEIASLVTPILLGVIVGAIASGRIQIKEGMVTNGFLRSWLAPFPVAVGCFALALFAFLAAVYLTLETRDTLLQEDFRLRALMSALLVAILALVVYLLAEEGAPSIRHHLAGSSWTWPLQGLTAFAATVAIIALWKRRYPLARICAVAQVSLILWGWGLAQSPYLVEPDINILNAAAPPSVMRLLLLALILGGVLLLPSFFYLYRIFKSRPD